MFLQNVCSILNCKLVYFGIYDLLHILLSYYVLMDPWKVCVCARACVGARVHVCVCAHACVHACTPNFTEITKKTTETEHIGTIPQKLELHVVKEAQPNILELLLWSLDMPLANRSYTVALE
jgi:hypothetical protein